MKPQKRVTKQIVLLYCNLCEKLIFPIFQDIGSRIMHILLYFSTHIVQNSAILFTFLISGLFGFVDFSGSHTKRYMFFNRNEQNYFKS